MDYLQEGIGLRAYAQRDPLVEYQREGFDLFAAMMESIKEETVGYLFHLDVDVEQSGDETGTQAGGELDEEPSEPEAEPKVEVHAKGLGGASRPRHLRYSAPTIDGDENDGLAAVSVASGPSSALAAGEKIPDSGQKVGHGPSRNAPCPCGSGKKYKKCHGAPTAV